MHPGSPPARRTHGTNVWRGCSAQVACAVAASSCLPLSPGAGGGQGAAMLEVQASRTEGSRAGARLPARSRLPPGPRPSRLRPPTVGAAREVGGLPAALAGAAVCLGVQLPHVVRQALDVGEPAEGAEGWRECTCEDSSCDCQLCVCVVRQALDVGEPASSSQAASVDAARAARRRREQLQGPASALLLRTPCARPWLPPAPPSRAHQSCCLGCACCAHRMYRLYLPSSGG